MSAKKVYEIVINGVKESTDSVEALSKQLDNLEQRIDKLNQKGVTVGGSLGKTSDLTAEQKIADQINQSMEKRVALQGELGKELANEKQLMKEVNAEAKAAAASDRLANGGYGNTMQGLKQELYDIKAAMQTTDLGSDSFTQMAQRADELNTKLKEIEQSYGQFGRNVGNYSNSIQEAFQQITVKVGDTEMKFNSTKEALRTLREGIKGMVVNGQEGTDEFKNMSDALHNLEMAADRADSAVQDLQKSSTGMDDALDWMQSFGALGQISQGFSSMFGGTGFEESIQKMMSLQSVLQGIEQIRNQMNTGEGFGKVFSSISQGADDAAATLLRVKGGMEGLGNASKVTQYAVKGLSTVMKGLAGFGVGLLIDGAMKLAEKVGNLVGGLFGWNKENENLVQSSDVAAAAIEYENKQFERMQDQLKKDFLLGLISQEEYLAQKADLVTEAMQRQIKAYQDYLMLSEDIDDDTKENLRGINGERDLGEAGGLIPTPPVIAKSREELEKYFQTYQDMVDNGKNQTAEMYGWIGDLLEELPLVGTDGVEDAKKVMTNLGQTALGEFEKMYDHAMETMKTDTKGAEEEMKVLLDFMNGQMLTTVFLNLDQYVPTEGLRLRLQQMKNDIINFMNGITFTANDLEQLKLDALPSGQRRKVMIDKQYEEDKKKFAGNAEAMELVEKKHQNQLNELARSGGAKRVSTAKSTAKQQIDVEKETQKMHLDLMAEGYQKELTRLKYERDEQLRRYKGHSDLMLKAEEVYQKKARDLREKYEKETREEYKKLWSDIYSYTSENLNRQINTYEDQINRIREIAEKNRKPASYGGGKLFEIFDDTVKDDLEKLSDEMRIALSEGISYGSKQYDELVQRMKKEIGEDYGAVGEMNRWLQVKMKFGEQYVDTFEKLAKVIYDINENIGAYKPEEYLKFDLINDDLAVFKNNIEDIKQKYGQLLFRYNESWQGRTFERPETFDIYEEMFKKQKELLNRQRADEIRANGDWMEKTLEEAQKNYDKQITLAEGNAKEIERIEREKEEALTRITDDAMDRQTAIINDYEEKQKELERHINDEKLEDFRGYFEAELQEVRDYYDRVNRMMENAQTPNEWGFINLAKIDDAARQAEEGLSTANEELKTLYANLYAQRKKMPAELFKQMTKEVLDMIEEVEKKMKEAGEEPVISFSKWIQQLDFYLQQVSQAVQQVWGELDNLANYNLDRQQDALDKENEMLQDKLDEQEEILERHKERVDSIEGQLADARGDRRERLIDALNEEIIAQRRAQSEKERLEKEQEKLEEKQKELDFQRELNQYYAGLRGILFNTAQAVMQAANNTWPLPAIPLMALATAAGAAQYAIASQQRPVKKAEGGLLMGASHANGGIPVGGTGIEVEGGEYVIRKSSTADNIELLDYINDSKRKLTAIDMLEFFRNGGKTIINNTSKTRFADGGMLDISDYPQNGIISAFNEYANRQYVVSVVDINQRQSEVRNVEVLAGLN